MLLLAIVDRAFVHYRPHWEWVVREFPPNQVDAYRVEAVLRTTAPDPRTVAILGDSTALASLDAPMLDRAFADRERHFLPITLGGTHTLAFGFLAEPLLALGVRHAVLVVSPYSTRSTIDYDRVQEYDVRAVPALFTLDEVLAEPRFHLEGMAKQGHVFIRHRWVLQQSLQVALGFTTWSTIRLGFLRDRMRQAREGDFGAVLAWIRGRVPERYPNPNTRAIRYLARRLREAGGALVLMESPAHPVVSVLMPPARVDPFRTYMREIADREGILYITGDDLPALGLEHFEDQSHLNPAGSAIVTAVVAERLREVL